MGKSGSRTRHVSLKQAVCAAINKDARQQSLSGTWTRSGSPAAGAVTQPDTTRARLQTVPTSDNMH